MGRVKQGVGQKVALNIAGILGAYALLAGGLFTGPTSITQNVGVAQTRGLAVANITAATVGSQKWSPVFEMEARGWETTGGTSQAALFRAQLETIQGATLTSRLRMGLNINGGAFVTAAQLTSTGGFVVGSSTADPGAGSMLVTSGNIALSTTTSTRIIGSSNILYLQSNTSASATQVSLEVNTTIGSTGNRFQCWAYAGSMSAGMHSVWGDGSSLTEMMGLSWDGHLRLRNLGQFQGLYSGTYRNLITINASAMITVGAVATTELTLASGGVTRFNSTGIDWRFMTNSFAYILITDGVTQWGKGDASAAPVSWTHRGANSRGGTDTDIAGGSLINTVGLGTGAAALATWSVQATVKQASGSAQQVASTVFSIDGNSMTHSTGQTHTHTAVKTTAYTILITDNVIYVDPATPFALTLPAPATVGSGKVYQIVSYKAVLTNMTLVRAGSEKINNVTGTFTFGAVQTAFLYCNGTDWAVR